MNSSQLLYKISNLQYTIRMKEVECKKAISANDQPNIDLNKAALAGLKESLAATIKEFDSVPAHNNNDKPDNIKKPKKWWKSFFTLKAETNRK
jgi:hypothetical protein